MKPHDPWPTLFVVPRPKIVDYLLNPDHAEGASKCAYLTSYGFDRSLPDILDRALVRHACTKNFVRIAVPRADTLKFVFDGPLAAPNGRDARLITVWQLDRTTGSAARFITGRPSR